ncbi:Rieske (2Fe-2S) protein [Paenibacillus hexagrammi]|uniref:Rieske (2Fe-2S) protein n=1 Tax=Paenibacillus hexagrammi TaxID=2908839 RepID=A0ABY3SG46_9BACL|nr:Rieske (2Fe-2S) protein [Paenibacillus sp. YPD9-1]UJF33008.1 Rieske (2Fe-2S) protein [Paenibacillus sp. YPD9-1]
MKEIALGPLTEWTQFPVEVEVEQKPYFLVKENDKYELFSRKCPHAGDIVELEDGEFVCPMHGWTFEAHTGRCHNVPSAALKNYEVIERNGHLFVQI